MKLILKKGTTSQTALIFVQNSSVTTGAGLTGLAWNSSSLTWYYYREAAGTGATQVTLATMTIGTWATGGFIELDATDMPGWYEIGIPNAVLAAGADFVGMVLKGATNMAQVNIEIQLADFDLNSAAPNVNVTEVAGTSQTAGDLAALVVTADAAIDVAVADLANGTDGLGALKALLDAVATTADLLDKLGAVDEAAAAGDPSATESVMQYVKQIVNVLIGTTGVVAYPAEAAPANAVSLAEVIRAIHSDVTGLAGSAMRGTDSAALASVCTVARLSELDAATGGKMANQVDVVEADTDAILVDTANMQPKLGAPAGADMSADIAAGKVDTAAILVDTGTTIPGLLPGALVGGRMDADVGAKTGNVALSTQEKADVNAETVDVLKTDTIAQRAQGLPPSTPTFEEALMYLYQFLRNKRTQTSSEIKLFGENETTVIAKAAISDDATTFTKAEFATGP